MSSGEGEGLFPNADRARDYGVPPALVSQNTVHSRGDPGRDAGEVSEAIDGQAFSNGVGSPRENEVAGGDSTVTEGVAGDVIPLGKRRAVAEEPSIVPPAPTVQEVVHRAATRQAERSAPERLVERPLPGGPAMSGWRGAANRLTGGVLQLSASDEERRRRRDAVTVLRSFRSTQTIVVANPKGGAGKTPTTLLLAATLGFHRGGYTLAWDNNETRGTLGERSEAGASNGAGNVIGLLEQVPAFLSVQASVGSLGGFVRPQSAHFDVLASDDRPGRMEMVDDVAYRQLLNVLARFYRLLLIDTGNNVRAPNFLAAVRTASCLVVPTSVQADVANSGLWMLDHLDRLGRPDLVRNAVAVVTCAAPDVDRSLLADITGHYREVVRDVVVVPYDRHIAPGGRMSYRGLAKPTRRALLSAAVAVIESLSEDPAAYIGGDRR